MSVYYRHLIEDGKLLDIYPNAAVAYSLRKLREGYKKVFNLLTYSEDISQAVYTKTALVTTSYTDVEIAPDGTMTADKLIEAVSVTTFHFLTQQFTPTVVGLDYNFSVYLKAGERVKVDMQVAGAGTARINLLTGAIESSTFPTTPIVTDAGNNWWRFSVTFNASSTIMNPLYRIFIVNNLNQSSYVGDGVSGLYVWGFQLTQSSSVLPYEKTIVGPSNGSAIRVRRTSDSTEQDFGFDSSGDLDTTTLLDFVGYNLFAWSEQLQQPYWAKTNLDVTTDTVIAPDSTTTGDILFETTTNGVHTFQRSLALTNGQLYTVSFWIKDEGRNHIRITTSGTFGFGGSATAWLDLSLGVIVSESSGFDGGNLTLTPDGDWYKVSYTLPATTTGTMTVLQLSLSPNGSNVSYVGNTSLGISIWGLQLTESSTIRPYRQTLAIGEGQCTITTWYDQSGNGVNATQGTVSSQSTIVVNGNLLFINGKVAASFGNDFYFMTAGVTPASQFITANIISRPTGGRFATWGNRSSNSRPALFSWNTDNNVNCSPNDAGQIRTITNSTYNGQSIVTTKRISGAVIQGSLNGVQYTPLSTQAGQTNVGVLGGLNNVHAASGFLQETIWWNQNYSSLELDISNKINEYYGIY